MASKSIEEENMAAVEPSSLLCSEDIAVSATTVLDLKDDCLREICEHLELYELCVFADVCSRFKQIAQVHFEQLNVTMISKHMWRDLKIRNRYRLIRNFGASISSLEAVTYHVEEEALIDMILRYCGESLNALTLTYFELNEDIGRKLRPLLLRLRKFGIIDCDCTGSFFDMLPSCLLELRELELKSRINNNLALIRNFPKLESFSNGDLNNTQFKNFLTKNQQLKSIELDYRCRDPAFFNIITEHLPLIESLNIFVRPRFSSDRVNKASLREMTALKKLMIRGATSAFSGTLRDMAAANIPIETFAVSNSPYRRSIMDTIPKFENVKVLQLIEMQSMSSTHLRSLAENLGELTELYLQSVQVWCRVWKENSLIEFIKAAKNIQKLYYVEDDCYWHIDADIYMEIVNIVKNRRKNNHLEIISNQLGCPENQVPNDLIKENKHFVNFQIKKPVQIIEFGYESDEDDDLPEPDSDCSDDGSHSEYYYVSESSECYFDSDFFRII